VLAEPVLAATLLAALKMTVLIPVLMVIAISIGVAYWAFTNDMRKK